MKEYLTPPEVAEKLGISLATVHSILRRGEMKYGKFGERAIRIKQEDLARYIAENTHGGNGHVEEEVSWR